MLRIAVSTFIRKVDEGALPKPSLVLGERNPRWNVKTICDAMSGLQSEKAMSPSDLDDRIDEMAL